MINNIGNRTFGHPVWSIIILVIKQIRPFLMWMSDFVITCMFTDQIGIRSVVLPLFTIICL